ncbi:hypothetical protein ACFLT9_10205 [Acidobacteriota bacterium]
MTEKGLGSDYSTEVIHQLEQRFAEQEIFRPLRIQRFDPGTVRTYDITGVVPAVHGRVTLRIEKYVGGGFAGQVYKTRILEIETPGEPIRDVENDKYYALKILNPASGFARFVRSLTYIMGFQAPFSLQVNRDAARSGALWQRFIRRGARIKFGTEEAVVNILATLVDSDLGSCGEISEWVEGRMWRFEVDDDLDARKRNIKEGTDSHPGSPEYLAKRRFMSEIVDLMEEMGAYELARQYSWWTMKSQPNSMKRLAWDMDPKKGHVAVDFRAGMALLPFMPQSPGDFKLILKGLMRGSLVQFDRGDRDKLRRFIEEHKSDFSDMEEALSELEERDSSYRNSQPDITHHHIRLLYSRSLWSSILDGAIKGWEIRNYLDNKSLHRLQNNRLLCVLYYLIGIFPFLGKFLRKMLGNSDLRKHYRRLILSPRYLLRARRASIAENLMRWHRKGRINAARAIILARNPVRYLAHIPPSLLPVGLHRFLTDRQYARKVLHNIFVHPVRLYFKSAEREKWLRDMIEQGQGKGMLTQDESKHILSQIKEPFIQKYLKSLAVHICTVPVTQIVSVIVAFIYVRLHPEFSWQESMIRAGLILGLFQVTPVSPGSIARGLYVTFLVIREKNFKDYNIAFYLSFFKYIGYLAFPIQMAYRYPELARFMAGHWATSAVNIMPIFGERGALLEHAVFDLFYNYPLTIRHRLKEKKELRSGQGSRTWHLPLLILSAGLLLALIDYLYFQQAGHLPGLNEVWWLVLWIPLLFSTLVSKAAGGASMAKRLVLGLLSGMGTALLYTLFKTWLLPSFISGISTPGPFLSILGQMGLMSLWLAFIFSLLSLVGVFFIETRPLAKIKHHGQ